MNCKWRNSTSYRTSSHKNFLYIYSAAAFEFNSIKPRFLGIKSFILYHTTRYTSSFVVKWMRFLVCTNNDNYVLLGPMKIWEILKINFIIIIFFVIFLVDKVVGGLKWYTLRQNKRAIIFLLSVCINWTLGSSLHVKIPFLVV